jgi:hypothetical protein
MYSTKEVQTYSICIFHQVQQQNDYKEEEQQNRATF